MAWQGSHASRGNLGANAGKSSGNEKPLVYWHKAWFNGGMKSDEVRKGQVIRFVPGDKKVRVTVKVLDIAHTSDGRVVGYVGRRAKLQGESVVTSGYMHLYVRPTCGEVEVLRS